MADRQPTGESVACPLGRPDPNYSCVFCLLLLHSGSSGCGCSEFRPEHTRYASLCHACAAAVDMLDEDSRLGRVHRALVQRADLAGRHCDDIGV